MLTEVFLLEVFSITFIVIMVVAIVVPYMRGRRDLFTSLNLFLAGSAIFVGLSGLNAVASGHFFPYEWQDYIRFYMAILVFYGALLLTYGKFRVPERAAVRHARKLRLVSTKGIIIFTLGAVAVIGLQVIPVPIPGLSNMARMLSMIAPSFAIVLAFFAWDRSKTNPIVWIVLVGVVFISISTLFALGGGRRSLYGALFGIPLCFYWRFMRYWQPKTVLILMIALAIPAVILNISYISVRWAGTARRSSEISGAGERLDMLANRVQQGGFDIYQMSQTGVEYSLTTIYVYNGSGRQFSPTPLHTLYVLATFPIPRAFWPGKPVHLGMTILYDAKVFNWGERTTVGPGIAGHIYHDGGLLVAILYGFLAGGALRYIDVLLVCRRNDPLVIAFFSGASFHIIGWSRGDIATFSVWPAICFGLMLALQIFSRTVGLVVRPQLRRPPNKLRGDPRINGRLERRLRM